MIKLHRKKLSLVVSPSVSADEFRTFLAHLYASLDSGNCAHLLGEVLVLSTSNEETNRSEVIERFLRSKRCPAYQMVVENPGSHIALMQIAVEHAAPENDIAIINDLSQLKTTWLLTLENLLKKAAVKTGEPQLISFADWFCFNRLNDIFYGANSRYSGAFSPALAKFALDAFFLEERVVSSIEPFPIPVPIPGCILINNKARALVAEVEQPYSNELSEALAWSNSVRERGCNFLFLPTSSIAGDSSTGFSAYNGIFLDNDQAETKRTSFRVSGARVPNLKMEIAQLRPFEDLLKALNNRRVVIEVGGSELYNRNSRTVAKIKDLHRFQQHHEGISVITLLPSKQTGGESVDLLVDLFPFVTLSLSSALVFLEVFSRIKECFIDRCVLISTSGWKLNCLFSALAAMRNFSNRIHFAICDFDLLRFASPKEEVRKLCRLCDTIAAPTKFTLDVIEQAFSSLRGRIKLSPPINFQAVPALSGPLSDAPKKEGLAVVFVVTKLSAKDLQNYLNIANAIGDKLRWIILAPIDYFIDHPFIEYRRFSPRENTSLSSILSDIECAFSFFNSSFDETFPWLVFDSIASGFPVLTTFENAHLTSIVKELDSGISFNHVVSIAEYLKADLAALQMEQQRFKKNGQVHSELEYQREFFLGAEEIASSHSRKACGGGLSGSGDFSRS